MFILARMLLISALTFSVVLKHALALEDKNQKRSMSIQMPKDSAKKIISEIHRDGFQFTSLKNEKSFNYGSGSISTRGNYSIKLPKKSFRLELETKGPVFGDDMLKVFYLISMAEDPWLMNSHFAYSLASRLNLFFSRFFYIELFINGESQGVYLAVERPEESLRRMFPDALGIGRRGAMNTIDVKYSTNKFPSTAIGSFIASIESIPSRTIHKHAVQTQFSKAVNSELYFKYLAFNRLLMNGDYSRDEVYFTVTEKNGTLFIQNISVWDCDDLFQGPWNGTGIIYATGEMSLVYEGTSALDRWIAFTPPIYRQYLSTLEVVLSELNESVINEALQDTFKKLEPYLTKKRSQETLAYMESLRLSAQQSRSNIYDSIRKYRNYGN